MRHRLAIAAALLTLPLAACGDDSPAPKASPSTSRPSASPSPTGPTAPVLPEAAKENTSVGAKAFARHWIATVNYAAATGETAPLSSASTTKCTTCNGIRSRITKIYGEHQRLVGGDWTIRRLTLDPRIKAPDYRFVVEGEQTQARVIDAHGKVTSRSRVERFVLFMGLTWNDGFRVFAIERIDD